MSHNDTDRWTREAIDIVTQKILNGGILLIGDDVIIEMVEEIYGSPAFEEIDLPKGHRLVLGRKNEELLEFLSKTYLGRSDEIPGNDDERFKEFLSHKFNVDWVKTAEIEKKIDDVTIRLSNKQNFMLLKLETETTEVSLKIDDGRTAKFDIELENGKLKIYSPNKIDFHNITGLILSFGKMEVLEIEELNVNSVKDWVNKVLEVEYSIGLYIC